MSDVGSVAGRDIGMRQPSKAYPDLINKVVNYRVIYLDKLGGQQSYQTNGLRFNDYWHFRNWYLKETGNGKLADNLAGFTYTGDDGTLKTINPPKPKRDRETGEIIDMEPRLKTPTQRKMATAQSQEVRRRRANRYRDIKENAGKALKFAVGKIEKIGRTGELTFYNDNMLLEQDSQSELPVVYSEVFLTDGLNVDELDQLGTDFGDNLQFLIPTTQEAQLAFTVRNNGDGSVTIEAHSDVILVDQAGDGDSLGEGTAKTQGVAKRRFKVSGTLAKNRGMLSEIDGLRTRVLGFDRTKFKSGILDLITNTNIITAHKSLEDAERIVQQLQVLALEEAEAAGAVKLTKDSKGKITDIEVIKPGFIGNIAIVQSLLSEESSLGNPRVFQDILDQGLIDNKNLSQLINARTDKGNLTATARILRYKIRKGLSIDQSLPEAQRGEIKMMRKRLSSLTAGNFDFDGLTEAQSQAIEKMLSDQAADYSFKDRTKLAKALLTPQQRGAIYKKHNQADFKDEDSGVKLGEIVAYTVIPFRINEDGMIDGFVADGESDPKRPFKGVIRFEEIEGMPPPRTKIPSDLYRIDEVFPDLPVKVGKTKEGDQVVKPVSELSKEEQQKAISTRAGISAIQGVADVKVELADLDAFFGKDAVDKELLESEREYLDRIGEPDTELPPVEELRSRLTETDIKSLAEDLSFEASLANPDNRTITLSENVAERTGVASRGLDLNPDNASNLPFEPNNLNGFQAFMARMDQLFANKYANVFSLQRAVEKAKGAVVDISQDFINAETRLYGKTANDLEKLDKKVKVISEEMKGAGLVGQDVSQFLIARHAEERNALIAERTDGETLNGSGMSNERAQEVMDSFSPEQKAALESIASKVDAITKDTRKTMVDFGLETQETIDAFENMFKNYVPLGGLSVDEMSADTSMYPTGGAGMSIYGDTTRRARGRASEANNVLAQVIAQNAAVHAKARKNEALSSLYNLVKENGNTKVWKITKQVPFDAQSAVGVRVNGEQEFIVFTNPDHAKALKNMGVEKLDVFSKFMRRFSGFLRRSFTTANPEFIISNFARDIQSALFNAAAEADIPGGQIKSQFIATKIIQGVKKTLPALLKDSVGKDMDAETAAYFEEFKEDGGQTGWGFVKDVGTIAAEIEAEVNEKNKAQKARDWMMKNSIDVVENVNDAFENSIRLSAYIEARKSGVSRAKAAELAKNITVNFNRSGELGPVANSWYMFFNASVQGTVRLARSLGKLKDVRKPDGELDAWYNRLNAAQKMAGGLSLISGMLSAIVTGKQKR